MQPVPSRPVDWSARDISVVIPTYRRGTVLLDTLNHLLAADPLPGEILVVDQTESPEPEIARELHRLESAGRIRHIACSPPSIPHAMNAGLLQARGEVVLFLDDDVIPGKNLVEVHRQAHAEHPEAWAVVGQVIQPEDESSGRRPRETDCDSRTSFLTQDLYFAFGGDSPAWVANVIACHLSVKRRLALALGGFDENFVPPVSYRFETEFAKRVVAAAGKILFDPRASIRHLRAGSGGTRSRGRHLASGSPVHGVGDYYYALQCGRGWSRVWHVVKRPFREIRTKFHLTHPWYIPVKFIGELRAIRLAFRLHKSGPRLVAWEEGQESTVRRRHIVLVNTAAPDRPNGSMVRYGGMVRKALEQFARDAYIVEELNLAPTQVWLSHFPRSLRTPIRYLCIAINARRRLTKPRDCILHLLDGSHAYLLGLVGNIPGPLVITVHDMIPSLSLLGGLGPDRPGKVGAWVVRRSIENLARADAWVAVSGNTRDDLVRIAGAEPGRVHVVHHAVILPREAASADLPRSTAPYVLHVAGNNTFYKNRQGVVAIFQIIRQSEAVALKLVGAPPDADLLKQVEASGLGSAIEFLPNISEPELSVLYRNAAFLLFPSLYEGFGWPPLEAMAQGCPVVCSNAGPLPEIVGAAALVAPPTELAALANHGLRLLRDPDLRQRMVAAGFQQARRFTLEAMAQGLVEAYRAAEARIPGVG
jgi:glycosyltransferase involved in cell wall biosynthesis/GT2 family glycosyltransferase